MPTPTRPAAGTATAPAPRAVDQSPDGLHRIELFVRDLAFVPILWRELRRRPQRAERRP